jgi:hypothetical protein
MIKGMTNTTIISIWWCKECLLAKVSKDEEHCKKCSKIMVQTGWFERML